MIVVTVARKPCAEATVAQNTLANGCGGYAIDATRVGHTADDPQFRGTRGGVNSGPIYELGLNGPHVIDYPHSQSLRHHSEGRWPANLILEHMSGCRQTGTTKKKFSGLITRRKEKDASVGVYSPGVAPAGAVVSPCVDADGLETIATWDCEPGCPVAALDAQSGDRPSTLTGRADPNVAHGHPGSVPHCDSMFNIGGAHGNVYADSGGASRFFKQVDRG